MSIKTSIVTASVALCAALTVSAAAAKDPTAGQSIFQARCAGCHGATGRGDGPIAGMFKVRPRNLAALARDNGGKFPVERVYQSIDGRARIEAHGDSTMPVWGEYFMLQALDNRTIDPKDARDVVAGRILSVVYFLQSIQDE